ncbi:MAG: hypothetical protein VXW32_03185 [Myxococcota bacterium]|nr:hypothetical protein [Myxococcota bacterium]
MQARWMWLVPALIGVGCVGAKVSSEDSGSTKTDSGSEETGDTENNDTGCPEPGEPAPGTAYELDDSEFNASLGDKTFSGTAGHWNVRSQGCISSLTSTKALGSVNQNVTLEVYGDISGAGTYPIRAFTYSENQAQDASTFEYKATDPGVNLVVSGYANGSFLHGSIDGSFQTVDAVSGGASDLSSLVIENWPRF